MNYDEENRLLAESLVPTLDDYLDMCTRNTCKWCGVQLPSIILGADYPHPGGWPVHGMTGTYWLYRRCAKCDYEWALSKLGVPRFTGLTEEKIA